MDIFKNTYRRKSIRLKNWDYGWNGAYFITICIRDRMCSFGKISNGKIKLSKTGFIANRYFVDIPTYFPFVKLDAFVIMPNHVHGIIIIDKNGLTRRDAIGRDAINRIPTINTEIQNMDKKTGGITGHHNPMLQQSLATVIRWYKGRCTYEIRKTGIDFAWQSLFYDHIIRDTASFERIRNYIVNNPANWEQDKFHNK